MEDVQYTWFPPQYDTSRSPSFRTLVRPSQSENFQNFARVAKWCPDGSTFLAQCEDRSFQLFDTPNSYPTNDSPPTKIFTQPSPVLDFTWYPTASSLNPASFCFIASVRECPVKLLDASDGRLRASYRIVDHRERQIAPHSLTFNPTAERLYCGFEDAVEVFDVARPGEGTRLPTTPSKKSKDGLKGTSPPYFPTTKPELTGMALPGIISALAFVPSQGSDTYAAGSLNPTSSNIALFSENQGSEPVMFASGGPSAGVTQIQFNPLQTHIMYAAYRRHGAIYSWDLRSHLDVPLKTYRFRHTGGRTNQKITFDVDIGGSWLASGDHRGGISVFDIHESNTPLDAGEGHGFNTNEVNPVLEFDAHDDAIGSVAFHALHPILLSVSGSRHFESEEGSDSSDSDIEGQDSAHQTRVIHRTRPTTLDLSIKIWSFDHSNGQVLDQPAAENGID